MGQIVGLNAKCKRANLNALSQVGTPALGEHVLVSTDNSMNADGQGNFDCYIVGDGTTAATALEVKKINADIYAIITKNITESLTPSIVENYYLSKTDGEPVSNNSWFYSDEIEIPDGTITWEGLTLNTWYCANIVFYDANHEFLSMIQASSGSTTMVAGAKYFRFSGEKKNTYSVTWEHAVGINEDVEQLREDVDALSGGVQVPTKALVFGGAVNGTDSGSIYTWIYTEPADDEYYIQKVKTANSHVSDNGYIVVAERSGNTFTIVQSVPFIFVGTEFDASELKIKVLAGQYVGIRVAGLTWKSVSTPTAVYGSAYHVGTSMTPNMNYAYGISAEMTLVQYGSLDNVIYDLSEKADNVRTLDGKKIFLFGDSISSTDYPWYKQYLEKYTSAFVYNQGASGYNAAYQASNTYFAKLATVLPDFVVALVGGNDNGAEGSVGTFSATSPNGIAGEPVVQETDISVDYNGTYFVQAISHIIRKWYSLYFNFRETAGLSGNETQDERKAILDAMQKPKMVFCTTLPQKRSNASNAYSIPANWERKRQAVIECCEKYRVPMIDLACEFAIDWNIEPYWTSPTDKVNNNGVYTMDGLHPNEYGFDYISQIVAKRLLMFAE